MQDVMLGTIDATRNRLPFYQGFLQPNKFKDIKGLSMIFCFDMDLGFRFKSP